MQSFSFPLTDTLYLYLAKAISDEAKQYNCKVRIATNDLSADAKNLYSIMTLEPREKTTLTIIADGSDEDLAISYISSLVNTILPQKPNPTGI